MKNQWSENVNTGELLTSLELMSMLSISSTTLWRHVKNGELPKPVYIELWTRDFRHTNGDLRSRSKHTLTCLRSRKHIYTSFFFVFIFIKSMVCFVLWEWFAICTFNSIVAR